MSNRSLANAAVATLALLMTAEILLAQPSKKPPKKPTPQSNAQLVATIHKLRSVKHTLEKADHDYGGHRGAAVHAVKTATHELYLALQHAHVKNLPKTPQDFNSTHPPQVLSNRELAASIPALKNTHKNLQQGTYDYGGHRAKAVAHLGTAITQLEKALVYIKGQKTK